MQKHTEEIHADHNGYEFSTFSNDENGVRLYTLKNGLKVYLAQNFDAPKIQTYIPVRTGSNNDPSDNTGLSHYLEHMMFKGTSRIGTMNWVEEKKLLNEISDLYEQHKAETNTEKKKEIYKKIDEVSQEASKFAIANEYDKAISSLGATGTNAHTWLDETVYKNNIPKNELEKWLKIEQERFSELTLRLFHTELESVYEEFNRAQDNDSRLVHYELMDALFPTHPNGQQTTIGEPEHLKNPSMKAIYKYFDEYYVPNNYALVLVGDFEFDETIRLIDNYFGEFEFKKLPEKVKIKEKPPTEIVKRTVKSQTIPRVQIAWRTDDYGTRDYFIAEIISNILTNRGEAGLLDLNINQKQKALYAQAFSVGFKQYGYISAVIVPKENQTLEEGLEMLLQEIEKLKTGDFADWLIPAIINDLKIQKIQSLETANGLATQLYETYIKGRSWSETLDEMDIMESITKEEIVQFSKEFFKENYVVVFKEKGVNDKLVRVENPGITPVQINRDAQSDFLKEILNEKSERIEPQFVDYKKEIKTFSVNERKVSFVENAKNDLAQVHFIFCFGSDHDKKLSLSTQVLQYLGTEKYNPQELKEEFFKIGISHDFRTSKDQLQVSLKGLEENLFEGIKLLFHWLKKVKPNQEIYDEFVQTIYESREAAKNDSKRILGALVNYVKFGANSRMTDVISNQNLAEINVEKLMDKMRNLFQFPFEVFYFGAEIQQFLDFAKGKIQSETLEIPQPRKYPNPATKGKVLFADYDMVQMEMSKVGKGKNVETKNFGKINVFNEYFGRGLSSIVFQELRERKSLAYSAYVFYQANPELDQPDYVSTYIGTQPDKLNIAEESLKELMNELPFVEQQFETSKDAALKQIEATRINGTNLYFNYLKLQKLGIDYDYRKDIYDQIKNLSWSEMQSFYTENVKSVDFNTAIMGKKENLDFETISKMGEFQEIKLEEIFGY